MRRPLSYATVMPDIGPHKKRRALSNESRGDGRAASRSKPWEWEHTVEIEPWPPNLTMSPPLSPLAIERRKDNSETPSNNSFGITGTFRTGLSINAQAFSFGFASSSMMPKLDKKPEGIRGLYWSKRLFGKCWPCHGECLSDLINKLAQKFVRELEDLGVVGQISGMAEDDVNMSELEEEELVCLAQDRNTVADEELNQVNGVDYKPGMIILPNQQWRR